MIRRPVSLMLLAIVSLWATPATAQDSRADDPPAHISYVDGAAVLERDGRTDADLQSMPLLAGDRVRTQGGRVEVLFADGSALHLDANTVVDFQSDEVVRLLNGRIRLSVAGPARDIAYRVDAPSAWVQIADPGEYRVGVLRDGEVELAVLRGTAELINEQGRSFIRAGERTFARAGAAPSPSYVFNSAAWDSFDRWSEARRDQRLGVSAQYLPNDVRRYTPVFDSYGSWRYEQMYGYVWYPRVDIGWRPYHRGRWASLRPFGWTWIAGDPWGWPTHHYGRWGFSGSWFWIPGRTWGPAWVSWAYAPGYVSWCPLGWNNRPVLHIVNVNVFGGRRYNAWDAWTVVPRHHFGGAYVNVRSVATVRIDQRIHNSFVVRDSAPAVHYAVGRSASVIRTTGRYAVPRAGSSGATAPTLSTAGGDATAASGDRRLPAPARAPRTSTTGIESGTQFGSQTRSQTLPGSSRAVSRERGSFAGDPSATSQTGVSSGSAGIAGESGGVVSSRSRRTSAAGIQPRVEASPGAGAVTAPPAGAVRAVPRTRETPDLAPRGDINAGSGERARSRSYPSVPTYSPDASAQPGIRSSSGVPSYRNEPSSRSEPNEGGYRSRSVPRDEAPAAPTSRSREDQPSYRAPQAAPSYRSEPPPSPRSEPPPSYRSAPEGRRPSGPPPSAAPSRSGGEERRGGGDGGGARRRGGDSSPGGGGSARRR